MKTFLATLILIFLSNANAYDLSHKFGLGASGGLPFPVFGNEFNRINDQKWDASVYGRYHFNPAFGLDLGVSHEAFKGSSQKFNNANLLGFWRTGGAADLTPVLGAGFGFTRIKNFDPASLKLSVLARLGLEYGFSQCFSLAGLVDYQYVSKIMGDMPVSRAHIINPQIALTYYFGGENKTETEKKEAPAAPAAAAPEKAVSEATKESDIVSVSEAATLRSNEALAVEKPEVTVEFDSDKSTIKSQFNEKLKSVADYLNQNVQATGLIEGYTDSTGSKSYNKKLSIRRADAVREKLIEFGVDQKRLSSQGFGEENPIADNHTAEGRQKNRRTTVVISIAPNLGDTM